jgi:hypothetical protein
MQEGENSAIRVPTVNIEPRNDSESLRGLINDVVRVLFMQLLDVLKPVAGLVGRRFFGCLFFLSPLFLAFSLGLLLC